MTDLSKFLPQACIADLAMTASQLPRAAMMRVNFIPGVRQRLGWRGMRSCPQAPMSLTAKVEGQKAVYGFYPVSQSDTPSNDGEASIKQGSATFSLLYFPDPEEEIINRFSIAAGMTVYRDDYLTLVRDFPVHEAMVSMFHIADIELRYHEDGQAVLSLIAPKRDRVIAVDGITAQSGDKIEMLVPAGAAELDLPNFDLAMPFFETLAASFSYILEASPANMIATKTDYEMRHNTSSGESWGTLDPYNPLQALQIVWSGDKKNTIHDVEPIDGRRWFADQDIEAAFKNAKWWTPTVPGARHSMDKITMGIEELPKLIILTGFLGSGKTSFLSHFIDYQASRNLFVAIIQNEIGEKGLDARLLGQHYAVEEIDEGCVCCTLIDNLTAAIDQICQNYQPDFIIVETTGLANPANLLSELSELQDRLDFCSVTCMLDALNAGAALPNYAILEDQIRVSDTVLVNKTDLVDDDQIHQLECSVKALNPYCSLHRTQEGDISPREIYGVNFEGQHSEANSEIAPCACSHDGHDHQCVTHHHYGISSQIWRPTNPVDKEELEQFLLGLPPRVLRVKGLLRFVGDEDLTVCQHVPNSVQLTPYRGQDAPAEFLVFIGEELEDILLRADTVMNKPTRFNSPRPLACGVV